jgi:hypothetical protein
MILLYTTLHSIRIANQSQKRKEEREIALFPYNMHKKFR